MSASEHERRRHFRGKARPGRVLPIRFRVAVPDAPPTAWLDAETRNIGIGGAFIATGFVEPVGATLTIELALPTTDQVFLLTALVRWSSGAASDGMGIQFIDVDVDVLLELNDYFSSLASQ